MVAGLAERPFSPRQTRRATLKAAGGSSTLWLLNSRRSSSGHARMVALLAEIGRSKPLAFQEAADVERLRRELAATAAGSSPLERAARLSRLGAFELRIGVQGGIERLEQVLESIPGLSGPERASVGPNIDFWLAVGYLREAMTANCVDLRIDNGCVLVAGPSGAHREVEPADAALGHLVRLLRNIPPQHALYLTAKWLANIAYMQLGRYPGGVPEGLAFSPTIFEGNEGFRASRMSPQRPGSTAMTTPEAPSSTTSTTTATSTSCPRRWTPTVSSVSSATRATVRSSSSPKLQTSQVSSAGSISTKRTTTTTATSTS